MPASTNLRMVPVSKPKKVPKAALIAFCEVLPTSNSPMSAPMKGPVIIPQGPMKKPIISPITLPLTPALLPPVFFVPQTGMIKSSS